MSSYISLNRQESKVSVKLTRPCFWSLAHCRFWLVNSSGLKLPFLAALSPPLLRPQNPPILRFSLEGCLAETTMEGGGRTAAAAAAAALAASSGVEFGWRGIPPFVDGLVWGAGSPGPESPPFADAMSSLQILRQAFMLSEALTKCSYALAPEGKPACILDQEVA